MRASAVIEKAGIPVVAVIASGFMPLAELAASVLGVTATPIAQFPGVILTQTETEFREKVAGPVADGIVRGFVERPAPAASPGDPRERDPQPTDIVFRGDLDEVLEHFHARDWSDGLPIVPPTHDRVERFLAHSDRSPHELIGPMPAERRGATAWTVAVNGVMAGCRPEYFPLLLAIVDAITDPDYQLEHAGSTPGWEPLVIVSGPIVEELGFNSAGGAMRIGRQANSSVGRFLRLYLRNVGGLRIPPGTTDKASIGYNFNVALAENDAAVRDLGWPPFRVDRGFGLADSVVTVQSVMAHSAPIYSRGGFARLHLEVIARMISHAIGPWVFAGAGYGGWFPLLVLSPSVAKVLARDGIDKDAIRRFVAANARVEAGWAERFAHEIGMDEFSFAAEVARGRIPPEYAASTDPDRLVSQIPWPDQLAIVVAGDPERNQSRAYVNQQRQGTPTSRVIRGSLRR
jgi:hypothetical protein